MRILKREAEIVLNGQSPEFAGSPFEGYDFEIRLKKLGRVERSRIRRKFSDQRGRVDEETVSEMLFNQAVQGWSGFENEEGQPLVCNDNGKAYLWENCLDLANVVILAATQTRIVGEKGELKEEDEDELKN